jgi:hypothetical protein
MTEAAGRVGWREALREPPAWSLGAVLGLALVLRLGIWRAMGGPVVRGDGPSYLDWAERFARGDLSGFSDYPLHQLYPVLIAPAYVLRLSLEGYLLLLHMALSVGTVYLLYDAARQISSRRIALIVGAVAAGYPSLLLWSPFVLSETPFFFFESFFLSALLRLLAPLGRHGRVGVARFAVAALLLLFARPVSVALIAVALAAIAYRSLTERLGRLGGGRAWLALIASALIVFVGFLAIPTPARAAVLRYPTIAQSLWLSTKYASTSVREWQPVADLNRAFAERFAGDFRALYDAKLAEALEFIRTQPLTYIGMAVRRFVAYWLPALFADGWSNSHRLLDLVLVAGIYTGAALSLVRRVDLPRWTLLASALALGLLTSFSQIDTDGRYRVPAELILLLLAVDGLHETALAVWRRRATGPSLA